LSTPGTTDPPWVKKCVMELLSPQPVHPVAKYVNRYAQGSLALHALRLRLAGGERRAAESH
jgi:hypothetical protein